MPEPKTPNFSQIVCGASPVREAFLEHRPTRNWWRLILLLHGKPVQNSLSSSKITKRVADGFKFYAWLYRFLAVVFLLLAPVLFAFGAAGDKTSSTYFALCSLLAGLYLWSVSGLGYAGAKSYAANRDNGTTSLIAFMVMVVAFLSLFVAAISIVVQQNSWIPMLPNLAGAALLFVFGVGSYLIEIVYLATDV